ncbi:MAG: hypothetical protein HY901_27260 [Deltaproteobacteria bacterium]|nr:hypothetical protein [Deltaproteobacteria bacterium]
MAHPRRLRSLPMAAALVFGLVSSISRAQSWVALGPESAEVTASVVDPTHPETVYLGTAQGGVYRSGDRGATWHSMSTPIAGSINALVLAPGTPSSLFAVTGSGLFKSIDQGGSWTEVATGLSGSDASLVALAVAPSTPTTLYAASNVAAVSAGVQVLKTTDGGQSWQTLSVASAHATVKALAIDPTDAQTVYAGTSCCGGGLFKTTDGGASWTDVTGGIATKLIDVIAIDPRASATIWAATPQGLYQSVDGAATWQGVTLPFPIADRINSFLFDPLTAGTLYLTLGQRVLKSTDAGATWANASSGLGSAALTTLAIDPTDPARLYTGSRGDGVFLTRDAAAAWTASNSGLTASRIRALLLDSSQPPSLLFAGTYASGAFRSIDQGASWTKLNLAAGVDALASVQGTPRSLFAVAEGRVQRSSDNGDSWTVKSPSMQADGGARTPAIQCLAASPSRLYAGSCGDGVFRSDDSGESWTATGDLGGRCVGAIAIDPSQVNTVYLSASGGWPNPAALKSIDGGDTWQVLDLGVADPFPGAILVDPSNPQIVFLAMLSLAGGSAGLFRSSNGGTSWTPVESLPGNVTELFLEPASHALYAAVTGTGVFKSLDSGATWVDLSLDLLSFSFSALAADPQGKVFLGTSDLGAFSLEAGTLAPDAGMADAQVADAGPNPPADDAGISGSDSGTAADIGNRAGLVESGCSCSGGTSATSGLVPLLLALALGLNRARSLPRGHG